MREKIGFGASLIAALALGGFFAWYATPVPIDKTPRAELVVRAGDEQIRLAVRDAAASSGINQTESAQSAAPKREGLKGPALYDEAIAVSKLLRDPSSANYTLFDSESALAGELKARIYEMLRAGKTREEIFDYMVERYGEMIRYQPDFNAKTALLWAAPWMALGVGALLVFLRWTRRRRRAA